VLAEFVIHTIPVRTEAEVCAGEGEEGGARKNTHTHLRR